MEADPPPPVPPATTIPQWFQEQCARIQDEQLRNVNLNLRQVTPEMIVLLAEALTTTGNTTGSSSSSSTRRSGTSIQVLNLTWSLKNSVTRMKRGKDHSDMLLPLARAIQQNYSLQTLHLSYNKLMDVSSLAQCCFITNERHRISSSFRELHLNHNLLTDSTAKSFAAAIAMEGSTLEVLQLDYNNIGDEGGVAIARALKHNTSLKSLGLAFNRLGANTAHAFLETLEKCNVTIQYLALSFSSTNKINAKCRYLAKANQSGRYLLYQANAQQKNRNHLSDDGRGGLWSLVLARLDADMIFFFLTQKPSLVPSSSDGRHR